MDYERACQAYLWSTPPVSITAWRDAHTSSCRPTVPALTKTWKASDEASVK